MLAILYPLAFRGHGQTLRIRKTQAGMKFFIFEGMRFIVNDGKLHRASFEVGTSYMEYHQASLWSHLLPTMWWLFCCRMCSRCCSVPREAKAVLLSVCRLNWLLVSFSARLQNGLNDDLAV